MPDRRAIAGTGLGKPAQRTPEPRDANADALPKLIQIRSFFRNLKKAPALDRQARHDEELNMGQCERVEPDKGDKGD